MDLKLGYLICLMHLIALSSCSDNLDTRQPILRTTPESSQPDGYFGYSLVLHRVGTVSGTDREQSLANTRIVVSAPNVTVPNSVVERTGAIFTCRIDRGDCSPLSGTSGVARRLYDIDDNNSDEEKAGQFLGGSMASNGDSFLVCAHRYTRRVGANFRTPIGRCFSTTDRSLQNFQTIDPCPLPNDNLALDSGGICQVGTSSVITESQNQYTFGLGAPGYFSWRGVLIRVDPNENVNRQGFSSGSARDSYQGYAVTAGFFISTSRRDFAVSIPKLNNYFGTVNVITNNPSLTVVSQGNLRGMQMGEYYGFSLLSANLNGDGFEELIVGAPMYRANSTQPETGRIYVYNNLGGSLTLLRTIEGFRSFSRFGYALANLGDINGDGYDDIAVSAPFSDAGESGTVYIYHSSRTQTLSMNPQQIIVGSDLSTTADLTTLRGFGTSLASGVDVDANTYNDLAIGSFMAQNVILLRTRPLAQVTQTLTATPQIVDLDDPGCILPGTGTRVACFELRACVTYTGSGLSNMLTLQFTLTGDTTNTERRVVFPNSDEIVQMRNAQPGVMTCIDQIAYIVDTITDRFNPFVIEFDVSVEEPIVPIEDGNPIPMDLSTIPIVSSSGASSVQVETLKDCGGETCVPDLQLGAPSYVALLEDGTTETTSVITLGEVRNMMVRTNVLNAGEDAFQATITVSAPSRELEIGRLFGSLNNGPRVSLDCPLSEDITVDGVDIAQVTCSIGNPLAGPNVNLLVTTTLIPRPELVGSEGAIAVNFSVTSVNVENAADLGSNSVVGMVTINAEASVSLDPGIVSPEQISYSDTPPVGNVSNATELGPPFTTSFVVRNGGPSTVRMVTLTINWPLRTTDSGDNYFLYPAQVTTSGTGATVTCMNEFINPGNLGLAEIQSEDDQENLVVVDDGLKRKKRRRRNAVPYMKGRKLMKRQAVGNVNEVGTMVTANRTLSCGDAESILECVQIRCDIIGLQGTGNSQARVNIMAFLDERYFSTFNDRFTIIPTAMVTTENEDFLTEPSSSVSIPVIPASNVRILEDSRSVEWWVIFVPLLAAAIILAVIILILWALGFFKRRKHEELKQKKEELQNLEDNGAGPGMTSSKEDMVGGGTNL